MKLFEVSDINYMMYSKGKMIVAINGIVKYKNKETSIVEIECDYEIYCKKYLEFVNYKDNII